MIKKLLISAILIAQTIFASAEYVYSYEPPLNLNENTTEPTYPSWLGQDPTSGLSFPLYFSHVNDASYDGENLYVMHSNTIYKYDGISNTNKTAIGLSGHSFVVLSDKILIQTNHTLTVLKKSDHSVLNTYSISKGNSYTISDMGYDGKNLIFTSNAYSNVQIYIMDGISGTLLKQLSFNDPYTGGDILYDGEYIEIGGNNVYNNNIYLLNKDTYEIDGTRPRPMNTMYSARIFDGSNYLNFYNINSDGRLYKFPK